MNAVFLTAAAVAVISTVMVLTRKQPVHALLYLVLSFLAVAVILFMLGATFIAALEIVIYAGAIVVLFLFVVMLLNLGPAGLEEERRWLRPRSFVAPSLLAAVLLVELVIVVSKGQPAAAATAVSPKQVGMALYGPYVLGVEIASLLLLAGAVGAFHIGRRSVEELEAHARSGVRSPDIRPGAPVTRELGPSVTVMEDSAAIAREREGAAVGGRGPRRSTADPEAE